MAGRPPDPNRESTNYLLRFPDQKLINDLDLLAKREGISRRKLILKFCREGIKRHGPGNPQTMLNSYSEGGTQTLSQLVGQLRQRFYSRGKTTKREILEALKQEDINGPERVSICRGLIKWLNDMGVEVLQ